MTDAFEELRIIVKDNAGRLSVFDRATIAQAADEMERVTHQLIETQRSLIEANSHRIALYERLLHIARTNPIGPISMGPFKVPT